MKKIELCREQYKTILEKCKSVQKEERICIIDNHDVLNGICQMLKDTGYPSCVPLTIDYFSSFRRKNPEAESTQLIVEREGNTWYIIDVIRRRVQSTMISDARHVK